MATIWRFSYLYFDGGAEVIPPPASNAEVNSVVKATACGMRAPALNTSLSRPIFKAVSAASASCISRCIPHLPSFNL